ncbi:MAG TPA: COX15/CtaA family protein [Tepidisphaeraceae bacterium]|jgi:cytochrome c oxidase assembly protein subunit 15|nr:COX15/CtaA family protein [Tepidisphaeraceae bacterium]
MSAHSSNFPHSLDYGATERSVVASTPGVHWLATLIVIATFPLICMGGLVTTLHAGMSVPDWPNSYGYNMFLFPPSRWVGGIFYEHTHRLMGTVVGMLSIALAVWSWRAQIMAGIRSMLPGLTDWRPPIERHRYLSLAILAAVLFQGVLGGLRVVLVNLDLAIVHACVAQAFFCLAGYGALVTSRRWQEAPDLSTFSAGRGVVTLGIVTVFVVYLQLIVGATMRHHDAGLAIPDVPLAYGKWLPPTNAAGLAAVNRIRAFRMNLDPVSLGQIWLHFGHRVGALLVSGFVIVLAIKALRLRASHGLAAPAVMLVVLLIGQLTLGVFTVLRRKPADVASAHVAVGALVLLTSFILTMRAWKLYRSRPATVAAYAEH